MLSDRYSPRSKHGSYATGQAAACGRCPHLGADAQDCVGHALAGGLACRACARGRSHTPLEAAVWTASLWSELHAGQAWRANDRHAPPAPVWPCQARTCVRRAPLAGKQGVGLEQLARGKGQAHRIGEPGGLAIPTSCGRAGQGRCVEPADGTASWQRQRGWQCRQKT